MQARIILVIETPNDLKGIALVHLEVTKRGIQFAHGDPVEVHEFHVDMSPKAIHAAKVIRQTSDEPGDDSPQKGTMDQVQ